MNKVFIFALGAAAGSLVTWKIVEEKYKKIADEEIESVKEQFKNRVELTPDSLTIYDNDVVVGKMSNESIECAKVEIEDRSTYEQITTIYADGEKIAEENEEGVILVNQPSEIKEYIKPYVIAPEEFGEYGNDTKSLTYYSDFVLADEDDEIISDPEAIIGDALEHFGEYEDDSVHVRDENIECDYEILKSEKTFSEVYKGEN